MAQFDDNQHRDRIIKAAFKENTPNEEQLQALYILFDYVEKNGTKIPEIKEKDNNWEKFVALLDLHLKVNYNTDLTTLMNTGRQREKTMLRYFCYDLVKNTYPFMSDRQMAEIFGGTRARVSINIAIRKLRSDIIYDDDTAKKYKKFRQGFDILVYQNSIKHFV